MSVGLHVSHSISVSPEHVVLYLNIKLFLKMCQVKWQGIQTNSVPFSINPSEQEQFVPFNSRFVFELSQPVH